jgi:hypothetical protein
MSNRSDVTLFNEGQLITFAAQRTPEEAIEQARGVVDGCFNAMLRLGAAEDAAGFAFAVADRMVDRLKQPTAWPLVTTPQPALSPPAEIAIAVPPPPAPQRLGFWPIFAIGYACCAIPAAIIIAQMAVRL